MEYPALTSFILAWDQRVTRHRSFRHQASLHEKHRLVMPVSVPKPPPDRLTFTPPLLNAARNVLFLVTGSEKADALHAVLEGEYQPDKYPAQIVRPTNGEVVWMLDKAAAQKFNTEQTMINDVGAQLIAPNGAITRTQVGAMNCAPTLGLFLRTFKALATRYLHAAGAMDFAWQRNYHEHIARKEGNLNGIRQYIIDNPICWTEDEFFQ